MAPVPLSALRDLDLNQQQRPDKSKQNGTKPNDIVRPTPLFSYAPSAPPLSIDPKFLSPRGQHTSLSPVSPVSGSEASSYGSYIGSHLYAQPVGWNTQEKGSGRRAGTWNVGEEEMSISGRLASSGSSDGFRINNNYHHPQQLQQQQYPQHAQPTQRLTSARAMQRQLSSRSNDGFLFPSEDLDSNIQHNSMFTPDAASHASTSSQEHVIPQPFCTYNHQNDDAYLVNGKGSEGRHVGLALESPWKSPGWKVQQREKARERSGSVVMASVEEVNEIPKVGHPSHQQLIRIL